MSMMIEDRIDILDLAEGNAERLFGLHEILEALAESRSQVKDSLPLLAVELFQAATDCQTVSDYLISISRQEASASETQGRANE